MFPLCAIFKSITRLKTFPNVWHGIVISGYTACQGCSQSLPITRRRELPLGVPRRFQGSDWEGKRKLRGELLDEVYSGDRRQVSSSSARKLTSLRCRGRGTMCSFVLRKLASAQGLFVLVAHWAKWYWKQISLPISCSYILLVGYICDLFLQFSWMNITSVRFQDDA